MKKTIQTNYRVVVEPRRFGRLEPDWVCNKMIEEILEYVGNVGKIYMENDQIEVCEFCNSPWTNKNRLKYNGGCCHQDSDEHNRRWSNKKYNCMECGDSGRSYPTLENPDGVVCDCMLSRNDP